MTCERSSQTVEHLSLSSVKMLHGVLASGLHPTGENALTLSS